MTVALETTAQAAAAATYSSRKRASHTHYERRPAAMLPHRPVRDLQRRLIFLRRLFVSQGEWLLAATTGATAGVVAGANVGTATGVSVAVGATTGTGSADVLGEL